MYMGDLNKSKVVFSRCQNDVNKLKFKLMFIQHNYHLYNNINVLLNIDKTNFTK